MKAAPMAKEMRRPRPAPAQTYQHQKNTYTKVFVHGVSEKAKCGKIGV